MTRRRLLILGAGATAGVAGLVLLRSDLQSVDPAAVRERADRLGRRHGLRIEYGPPGRFFVAPFSEQDARIENGFASEVELSAVPPALDGIETSLAIYPPAYVARRCQAIFICGSLVLDGAAAGGTYGPTWIIVAAPDSVGAAGIRETARLGVHHELSSLIWNSTPALAGRWTALLPAGWKPASDNAEALKADAAAPADPASGFLSPYGATTAENDFNVYAETVFTDSARVAGLARHHPRVARKLALLIAGYELVDDAIGEVFERLGLRSFAVPGVLTSEISIGPAVSPTTTD